MRRHQGSIFWSLVLTSIGVLFLLHNLKFEIHPWLIIAKYWPLLIIFWGLSKLVSYFGSDEDPAVGRRSLLTGGEIVLLIFLLVLGSAITKAVSFDLFHGSKNGFGIHIGDEDSDFLGESQKSFTFTEEASKPLTKSEGAVEILNKYGNIEVNIHNSLELKVRLEKRIKVGDESKAKELAATLGIRINRKPQGFLISTNRDELDKEKQESVQTNLSIWLPKSTQITISNKYGEVSLEGVAGNHHVSNGYGTVKVTDIDGTLHVENQNGSVTVASVTGDCEVNNKYGSIELDTIGGKTRIENGYGSVVLRKMKGPVQLIHKYGMLDCSDLESNLSLDGRYVEVKGVNIGGDVHIATSYKEVDLENVQGAMTIQGKHGDINIKGEQPPSKPIRVDSEYSAVTITLPKESRFQIDAYSRYGKFVSEFEGGAQPSEFVNSSRIKRSHGTGGPLITINTSYRDINLNES